MTRTIHVRAAHAAKVWVFLSILSVILALPITAAAETFVVRTVDPATGAPLAGALVMIGPAPGNPFAGNHGVTGADGTILFDDPALVTPTIVTAGTADRSYVTITASPADSLTMRLPLRVIDTGVPPPVARVTGTAPGIDTVSNDGNFDLGFVLPALDVEVLLGTGQLPFGMPIEPVSFPVIGTVEMPGIVVMPSQVEFLFFTFEKPTYSIDLTDGTTQSLYCPAGRIAIDDLLSIGEDLFDFLNALDIREFGIERDVPISNGAVIDIGVDMQANAPISMQFAGVPAGDEIRLFSGAGIPGPGGAGERYVLFDGATQLVNAGTLLTAKAVVPGGDLADATSAAIAMHADTSSADAYTSAIIERGTFVPPANLTADSFFLVPEVIQNESTVSFTDPENPGVSPAGTWSTSVFTLVPVGGDPTVVTGMHWQVVAPVSDLGYTLPILPAGAPPGLPDPASTPGDDKLELTLTATNNSAAAGEILESMLGDATHFVMRVIDVDPPTTGIEPAAVPGIAPRVLGHAYPDPVRVGGGRVGATGGAAVELPIMPPESGSLTLEIFAADGRLVRTLEIDGVAGVETRVRWDGRDARGRTVPAGAYFARLRGVPGAVEKMVVVR
jgi:hypothetical protein